MKVINGIVSVLLMLTFVTSVSAQQTYVISMTIEDAIVTAQDQSPSAMLAKHNYIVSYWQFRTYKAQSLPSLRLVGNVGQYNRSLAAIQNSETGEFNYVSNNYLNNSISLSLSQNITPTGGTLSMTTSLVRLDQFSPINKLTYSSTPVNISYNQPINGFNSFRWEKKLAPKEYELAKRTYVRRMEEISSGAVAYFFNLLIASSKLKMAQTGKSNAQQLYDIACERFGIGSITKDELLQLELRLLNADIAISDAQVEEQMAMQKLRSYLGYNESVDIVPVMPAEPCDIVVQYDDALEKVWENSPDIIETEIKSIQAQQGIARAKSNTGLSASLYAQFGLNQVGSNVPDVYRTPAEKDLFGMSLSIPLVDWGLGKGRVKVARSQAQVAEAQIEQSINALREDIALKVMQFNLQGPQCAASCKAAEVGVLRYNSAMERFLNGTIGVTELNTAQSEMDNASLRYLQDINAYWKYYYNIRQLTMYDYIKGQRVEQDFDMME